MRFALLLGLLVAIARVGLASRSFAKNRGRGLGEPVITKFYDPPKEQWFEQILDHYNVADGRTWKQRYFANCEYFKPNGPIFLMIGGEGPASGKWVVEGAMIDYAKKYGAMCIHLEHRYYGMSHPTSDLSVKNLAYLSSEQALADVAYFIKSMRVEHKIPENKWIVFGGSYSGSLAAWMRLKYPNLVHGAVSSSGPLLAQLDFQEYYVIVEDSLRTHSQACVDAIQNATNQVHILLHHPVGQKSLARLFNFCDPIDSGKTSQNDTANLFESLGDMLADVVQYNNDNRNGSKINIDAVCDILISKNFSFPVVGLAEVTKMLLEQNEEKCLDYKYDKMITEMRNITWSEQDKAGGRQWMYQTCTEFGFYQTSTARPKLFSQDYFPVEFFVQQCKDIFGPRFAETPMIGIERTNMMYGALNLPNVVSNVVFVHGSIDPWHALGVTNSTLPNAPSIFIQGTAHCANVYPASVKDLPQLTKARKTIEGMLGEWLK